MKITVRSIFQMLLLPVHILFVGMLLMQSLPAISQHSPVVGIKGTDFTLNQKPFDFIGISFFNALYNPAFNSNEGAQLNFLKRLGSTGITVIRIWSEWNNDLGFVDVCDSCTLYLPDGTLRPQYLSRLKTLLAATASLGMVVELVLFSSESRNKILTDKAADKAVEEITIALKPYRNVTFQIWNEYDYRTPEYYTIIKQNDPSRIVSNSPGGGSTLGNDNENTILDYLSPHTTRQGKHWQKAAEEIKGLIVKFKKPVVDDEPARNGTRKFGGPADTSSPFDHILHIYNVWKAGGHVIYHHDMFQTGKGSKAVPPAGLPDPNFSEYHKVVFDFLKLQKRYK